MSELERADLAWAVRRLPSSVRAMLKKHPAKLFVAGGFVRSTIANEKIQDLDIFASDKGYAEACATELAGDGKPYATGNAYTVKTKPFPTQFIHRWTFADPAACIDSFDFTIAQAAFWWDGAQWKSACSGRYYADLAAKRLIYTAPARVEEVGGSMLRVLKFYQRGYRIPLADMGAVCARLCQGVDWSKVKPDEEFRLGRILGSLLTEVDPAIDPDHIAHLPDSEEIPV